MEELKKIADILKKEDNFLIISHSDPDGDAIGSMFALGYILKELGKNFFIFNPSGVPDNFSWLKPPKEVLTNIVAKEFNYVIFLDCSDITRVNGIDKVLDKEAFIINIDHHIDNSLFGKINWVDKSMSSVGEMVAYIAEELNVPIKGNLAESLFLAMVSDTGSFSYSNTTPSVLRIAAKILENGLDIGNFTAKYSRQWSIQKAHLHGFALINSKTELNGKVGIIKVSKEMIEKTGATINDCNGIVNYMRLIKGVVVAVSLREEEKDVVKFSLRSWGEVDVQKIAASLGGGGHPNASGGKIKASIDDAERLILNAIKESLKV